MVGVQPDIGDGIARAMTAKKAATAPRRLTPLNPNEEKRARELERVLVDAGYYYVDAVAMYRNALKANDPDREGYIKAAADQLKAAGAALAGAALALQSVPVAYRP